MNTALKARLNALIKQLDAEQQRALKGELESVLKKYERQAPIKHIPKRKVEQFERVSEQFNEWVDKETERKGDYTGLNKLTHDEKYEELHKAGAVPRKETRTFSEITAKSSNPLQSIDHAITRMKKLMTKQGQIEKSRMSREAFAQAFNLPGGGVLDKQLRKQLKSMSPAEWEIFCMNNKKLIARVWEEYHKLMEMMKNPNYMLGKTMPDSIPSLLLENVLTEIKATKDLHHIEMMENAAKAVKIVSKII